MSFNWTEYLTLSQELAGQSMISSLQEACLRAAISRAYYAVFCNARNFLINKDNYFSPGDINVHIDVMQRFIDSNNPMRQRVGLSLRSLRLTRNIVDYKDVFRGDLLARTNATLREAAEVIHLLTTL